MSIFAVSTLIRMRRCIRHAAAPCRPMPTGSRCKRLVANVAGNWAKPSTHRRSVLACLALAVCGLAQQPALAEPRRITSELEQYVSAVDPAFGFKLNDTIVGPGVTAYILIMDSLRWRDSTEVDRTLWTHQVLIIVPESVTSNTALFIINGGSNPESPPDELLLLGAAIASSSGSVLAAVSQIPNQPLLFADVSMPVREDTLVAYSWDKAMDTGDATWAAYLPMTKASIRGMDAVQGFVNESVADVHIDDFVVTGFSKRGATAWLVAAVDPRVRAVAPGVFDVLGMPRQIERHFQSYGFYSSAIEDYVNYDIVRRVRSPEGRFLLGIVDPLQYATMLDLPKLLLNATGDQFFLPDAANFYIDELPGETLIRQVPNTDHSFENGLVQGLESLLAWYQTTLDDSPRPAVSWNFDAAGTLTVQSDPPAESAVLWQAINPDARDFRLETIGAAWSDTPLTPTSPGSYQVAAQTPPDGGYLGYLVSLTFAGSSPPQTYGTPVFVTPDTLPFELDDAVGHPKRARYWHCQLPANSASCPDAPDFSAEQLQALLPLPVFGDYVNDLDALTEVLAKRGGLERRALRACMATRLNIAVDELGWYSRVSLQNPEWRLWKSYADAEAAAADGQWNESWNICSTLNQLQPTLFDN